MEMRAADARPELGERLEGLQGRYGAMVRQIVRRGRLEDREAAEAEVWARVWGALPRMVEREGGKAAAGRDDQSRCNAEIEGRREHRWGAWIARIAKRLVIDEKRRDEVARRAYGERAVRGAPEDGEEVDLDVGGWVEPDAVPDESGWGVPFIHTERSAQGQQALAALERLTAVERRVVCRWALGERERETAVALSTSWQAVRVTRMVAIGKLRGMVREAGWEE